MMSIKNILSGTVAIAGVTASLLIQRQAHVRFGENDALVRPQREQLAELAAECEHLSNMVAQANNSPADDRIAELVKLRGEAEALRKQTNELGQQWAESRRQSHAWWTAAMRDVYEEERYREAKHTRRYLAFPDPKAEEAKTLTVALGEYASEHQGEFPSTFEQVAPYLQEDQQRLAGTTEFEIVFQGSFNELTNVQLSAVAVIRERQARLTHDGKRARLYGFANANGGWPDVVESDDNFESWEAAHIIPPP
jgi:hypothetical protein